MAEAPSPTQNKTLRHGVGIGTVLLVLAAVLVAGGSRLSASDATTQTGIWFYAQGMGPSDTVTVAMNAIVAGNDIPQCRTEMIWAGAAAAADADSTSMVDTWFPVVGTRRVTTSVFTRGSCQMTLAYTQWGFINLFGPVVFESYELDVTVLLRPMPTTRYTYVDENGDALSGNLTVPEGNCDDDDDDDDDYFFTYDPDIHGPDVHTAGYPGKIYGVKLDSRPSSTVWITFTYGRTPKDDHSLVSRSSSSWTISPQEYDEGTDTRWIKICAREDDDDDDGTRRFIHYFGSSDMNFFGTAFPLTVQQEDND